MEVETNKPSGRATLRRTGMKQFNPKTVAIESETALAMIQEKKTRIQYNYFVGLDVHHQ